MTSRIISELALLSEEEGCRSGHIDYLRGVFKASAADISKAAHRALADLLFNFSWFNVSTIDSFFQNVLRIFTRELDLPETFSLEIDERYSVAVAVGEMLSSINLPPKNYDAETVKHFRLLKSWIKSYMDTLIEDGSNANLLARSSRINQALTSTISSLRGETFKTNSREILNYLSEPARIGRFVAGMNESLAALRTIVSQAAVAFLELDEAQYLPKGLRDDYLIRWACLDFSYSPLVGGRTALAKAIEPDGKRHNKLPKGVFWTDSIDGLLIRVLQLGMSYFLNETFYNLLRRQIYLLGLFAEACNYIEEHCRENESFLLGDTNSLLRKVICEEETPFVYERIGYMINHFLIDEFQDTSEMQWENLRPLVLESLSRNKDNLIIGDEKQCIYRFRNSKPELLGYEVENTISGRFGQEKVSVSGTSIEQNTNWRSTKEVVMFNNSLFAYLARRVDEGMETKMATSTYSGLIQQVASRNLEKEGYVKVIFGPEGDSLPDVAFDLEVGGIPEKGWETWTQANILHHLGEEIDRELAAGFHPRDIAILVRTHSQGQAVISFLLELMKQEYWRHGAVDIISSDALEISTSPAVQLVIGILRLSTTPQYIANTSSKKQEDNGEPEIVPNPDFLRNRLIHRYELCVFDQVDVTDLNGSVVCDRKGNPKKRCLTPEEALKKAIDATAPLPGESNSDALQLQLDKESSKVGDMDCPSLFAITERIIQNYVPEESRQTEAAFLAAFQDLVIDFEENGDADIDSFLKWWDNRGKYVTLPAPEGLDAINVMTIHQSKGLEFECVHLPFSSNRLVNYDGEDWYRLDVNQFPGINPDDVPPLIPLKNRSSYSKIPMLQAQIQRYAKTQMIDGLNVAYVAFTRAVSELVVYVDPLSSRGETLGSLIYEAAHKLNNEKLNSYELPAEERRWVMPLARYYAEGENGEAVLEIGNPVFPIQKASAETTTTAKPPQKTKAVDNKPKENVSHPSSFDAEIPYDELLNEYRVERSAEMILPEDVEQQGVFDINNERHVGNFLHSALSRVHHLKDLPLAVEKAAYRCAISERQWRPYLEKLTATLSAPQVRPWFEDYTRLMNERPLTAPDGLRRPDRVVEMPNGEVVVIDYKFGQLRKKYRDQVRSYMGLLCQCGYRNLRGYLIFPITGQIISVD